MITAREPVVENLANRLSAWEELEDGSLRWELHHQDTGGGLGE